MRGAHSSRRAFVFAVPCLLLACTEITTRPERAVAYQGEWSGPNVTLSIRANHLKYRRSGGALQSALVEGAFLGLSGNDIIYGSRKSRLKVSVPPHEVGGVWKMTVEGTVLTRAPEGGPGSAG